jgi:hypothetical protein
MSSAKRTTRMEKQEQDTSLVLPTSGCAKPGVQVTTELSSSCKVEGKYYPKTIRSHNMRVPVLDTEKRPLMPTTAARARLLLNRGEASAYWSKLGVFCIILKKTVVPDNQPLAVGIDPGSSFEGWSVVGAKATVLNGMSETPKHVKGAVEQRRVMRGARRYRNCRRRQCRSNRNVNKKTLPPSTFARWNAKVRILEQIAKIVPVSVVAVEDVAAVTKKGKNIRWNKRFSPLEQGKQWFYRQIEKKYRLVTYKGLETKGYREFYQLHKTPQKAKKTFSAHAVDAWVLAASLVGALKPTEYRLYYWTPIRLHRRQLHALQPGKGGIRRPYGSTRSMQFSRSTLVKDKNNKLQYIGGSANERVSLHDLMSGKRTTQTAKPSDLSILTRIAFRTELINTTGGRASSPA